MNTYTCICILTQKKINFTDNTDHTDKSKETREVGDMHLQNF